MWEMPKGILKLFYIEQVATFEIHHWTLCRLSLSGTRASSHRGSQSLTEIYGHLLTLSSRGSWGKSSVSTECHFAHHSA